MDYTNWLNKDGELSDTALDWAFDFSDNCPGEDTLEAVTEALPEGMTPELKAAIADVVLGMAYGMTLLLQSAPAP